MDTATSRPTLAECVAAVRAFDAFLGGILSEPARATAGWSVSRVRVVGELARHGPLEVTRLRAALRIDAGQLSRLLAELATQGVVVRWRSTRDRRRQVVAVTERGTSLWEAAESRSTAPVRTLVGALGDEERHRLLAALHTARELLSRPGGAR